MSTPEGFAQRMHEAFDSHRCNQLDRAEPLYRELLLEKPKDFNLLHLLGLVCYQTGRFDEADRLMASALEITPRSADAASNHGLVLLKLNRPAEAMKRFKSALKHDPKSLAAIANYATGLIAVGQFEDALQWSERQIKMHPGSGDLLCSRAQALLSLKRHVLAIEGYKQVIAADPKRIDALIGLAVCEMEVGNLGEAARQLDRALVVDPESADALALQAQMATDGDGPEVALALLEKACRVKPQSIELHIKRAQVLGRLERYEEALVACKLALQKQPNHSEALFCQGIAQEALFDFEGALESYQAALAVDPTHAGAHWNEAYCQLMLGQLTAGFRNYEWRWLTPFLNKQKRFEGRLWLGQDDVRGKRLLLHAEQGFGDTFQFLRYVRLVAELGAEVLLEVPKAVVPLVAPLFGIQRVYETDTQLPEFDLQCPLPSLPLALGTTETSIPNHLPYLFAEATLVSDWRERLGEARGLRIGVVWSGNPDHVNDANRSISLDQFLDAFSGDVQLIALQKEFRASDATALKRKSAPMLVDDQLKSFADTAAIIELCDLVVCIDTGVAHLAAAMNKPTWILVDMVSDWRWQRDRTDSPWYPNVKLYRQTERHSWSPVLLRVRGDIKALLPKKGMFSFMRR